MCRAFGIAASVHVLLQVKFRRSAQNNLLSMTTKATKYRCSDTKTRHGGSATWIGLVLTTALSWHVGVLPQAHGQAPLPPPSDRPDHIDLNGVLVDFDGVQPSLRVCDDSSLAALKLQTRTDQSTYRGRRSEYVRLIGKRGGERIFLAQGIVPVALISELEVSSWVKGNRPGFQILMRVRLPRARDSSGAPSSLYIWGERYETTGQWQQLHVTNFKAQFEERIRAMRAEHQRPIDSGEAYVDQVVFNLFGGAGENEIWIDDLAVIAGIPVHVAKQADAARSAGFVEEDWKNTVPRVSVYRGQPLSDVARQGFNGVLFLEQPTDNQLDAVLRNGLRIVYPPHPKTLRLAGFQPGSSSRRDDATQFNNWTDLSKIGRARWLPLRKRIRQSVFSGSSGFVFDAERFSIDAAYRGAVCELVNLELQMFEPWIVNHESLDRFVRSRTNASYAYMGMFSRHAGLVWVPRDNATLHVTTIDVPDSYSRQAHSLAPGDLSSIASKRVPGGVRLWLNRNNPFGLLLLTNQPRLLRSYADQMARSKDRYNELLLKVIRSELLSTDHSLSNSLQDPEHIVHLRKELNALHARLAPVLEQTGSPVGYQELDHFLSQLERIQQFLD